MYRQEMADVFITWITRFGRRGGSCNVLYRKRRSRLDVGFRVVGTLFAQENVKDKKILIRNEINIHFIRYFGGTYTVNVETDDGPTVVFTCPLVDF